MSGSAISAGARIRPHWLCSKAPIRKLRQTINFINFPSGKIQQALSQDRDFVASMTPGRPLHRRLVTVLFFLGVVLTLSGVVMAQLTPGGIALCFYGVVAIAGSLMGHRRLVTGTG